MRVNWTVFATNELHKVRVIVLCMFLAMQWLKKFVDKATLKNGSASTNPIRPHFEGPTARFLCLSTETFLNARTCAVATATSSTCMLEWRRSIRNWVSFYFKISRAPRVLSMSAFQSREDGCSVGKRVQREQVLCRGRLLRVSGYVAIVYVCLRHSLHISRKKRSPART